MIASEVDFRPLVPLAALIPYNAQGEKHACDICWCLMLFVSVIYCAHLCMKCSLSMSNFPEEVSCLSHSTVFLFFAPITEEGFLISPCYFWNSAFKWVYLSLSPLLFTSLLFSSICKASSTIILPFCVSFSWGCY